MQKLKTGGVCLNLAYLAIATYMITHPATPQKRHNYKSLIFIQKKTSIHSKYLV